MGSMCVAMRPRFSMLEALAQRRPTRVIATEATLASAAEGCPERGCSLPPFSRAASARACPFFHGARPLSRSSATLWPLGTRPCGRRLRRGPGAAWVTTVTYDRARAPTVTTKTPKIPWREGSSPLR